MRTSATAFADRPRVARARTVLVDPRDPGDDPWALATRTVHKQRAQRYPGFIEIRPSTIPGAELGAFTNIPLNGNLIVGTYMGVLRPLSYAREHPDDLQYVFETLDAEGRKVLLDARRPEDSNWTRYVNCSRNPAEENITAVQLPRGGVAFQTRRRVQAGEELLFFYSREYAEALGIAHFPAPGRKRRN